MHLYVHCSVIYNSEDVVATHMPISRWLDKEDVVHVYKGMLLGHTKEWNLTIRNSMDGPGEHYAK